MSTKNYITNGDLTFGLRGFVTYNDGAVSRPVDGVGGTPTVSISVETAFALAGDSSLRFSKPASNAQGQGVSTDFKIDAADQAKPLQIDFDWTIENNFVGSTNPAVDSDVIVYLYDITNARLIEPSGRLLEPAISTQKYRYRGTFQTSPDSVDYRLIYHVATTSTSTYDIIIDNIRVGPQVVSNGAVVTDWQSYTPTGSWNTNSTYTGRFRRVGDNLEVQVGIDLTGAPNSAALTINIPTGLTIDTTKLVNSTTTIPQVGIGTVRDTGINNYPITVHYNSTTSVAVTAQRTVAGTNPVNIDSGSQVTQAVPFSFNTGDQVQIDFKVPIVGWSSNVQMSNDTDTRVVALAARQLSPISVTANNPIPYSNVDFDTHGGFNNPTAGRYRIPVSGIYRLSVTGIITSSTQAELELWVNGVNTLDFTSVASNATRWDSGSITRQLNAGDIIDVRPNSTATVASYFFAERLSGPSQVAASEAVYASATSTAGQSVPSSAVTIMQTTAKDYDSHNALQIGINTRFTAPISGLYEFNAFCSYNSNQSWTEGNVAVIELAKNGVINKYLSSYNAPINDGSGGYIRINGSADVWLNAGDYVEPRLIQNSGGAKTLETSAVVNYFQVKKVN